MILGAASLSVMNAPSHFRYLMMRRWILAKPIVDLPILQARVEHANALIQVIAAHGRRFFFNAGQNAFASMSVDSNGVVWIQDDYTRMLVNTMPRDTAWKGFSHGGTLRSLVEDMRDYIVTGNTIALGTLGPERMFNAGNIWGYEQDQMAAVRIEASVLPIMDTAAKATDCKSECVSHVN